MPHVTTQTVPPPLRHALPERAGIVEAIGALAGRNRVAAAFYDGPGWKRFRFWEHAFLAFQGGQRRARRPILANLPRTASARVLEVGIGEGNNVPLLPASWELHGVDIARTRLEDCLRNFPVLTGRLVWAEGERLPYEDASFDACYSIGGFNYFGDHAEALHEMRRVTRPGGIVVVADEAPWLHRCGIGHLIGLPRIDAAWLRSLGLDREFADMVIDLKIDLDALFPPAEGWHAHSIWRGLGYCRWTRPELLSCS
jgi:SAM-dependent methyltransferase